MSEVELPPLFNPDSLAKYLGIDKRTLWRKLSSKSIPLPDWKDGRIIRWKLSTINSWLNAKGEL